MKGLQRIKSIKWLTNLYVIIGAFFVVWMLFFDSNSVLIQWQLRKEIRALEQEKNYLEKEIEADLLLLKKFKDSIEKERYAREQYLFKRDNEDLYLIEYADSIKSPKF
jgi:cell division protein DivIC